MLLCAGQVEQASTPTEGPHTAPDVLSNVSTRCRAPWLERLLDLSPDNAENGLRPLPWLTPSISEREIPIKLNSAGNALQATFNNFLSVYPGSIMEGEIQPYLVGYGPTISRFCQMILVSIANPRVFHLALHTGLDSNNREFGLQTFSRAVLHMLTARPMAKWLAPFSIPSPTNAAIGLRGDPLPKNISIRFGAHRLSIYGAVHAAKTTPLLPNEKDAARKLNAGSYIRMLNGTPRLARRFRTRSSRTTRSSSTEKS